MGNGGQAVGQVAQAPRRQDQGVAAGDDHLPDAGSVGNVADRGIQRRARQVTVPVGPDHLPAEAEAAIDGTGVGDLQQYPVGITVDDARHRAESVVSHRIGGFVGQGHELAGIGKKLGGYRVGGIGRIDQPGHGRGHGDGITRRHPVQGRNPIRGNQPPGCQVRRRPEGAAHRGTGDHRTSSICRAPVARRASRSKPRAAPEAGGICSSAFRRSSSRG